MIPAAEVGAGRYPDGFLRAIDAALDLDPHVRLRSAEVFQAELLSGIEEDDDDLPPTVRIQRASEPGSPPSKPKRSREGAVRSSSR